MPLPRGTATLAALLAPLLIPTHAHASLITFDDLPQTDSAGITLNLPTHYASSLLTWDNFVYYSPLNDSLHNNGYKNALASAPNLAFNGIGSNASLSAPDLDFLSAWFTAGWNDNLQLTITASRNDSPIYSRTFTLSTTTPHFLQLNLLHITTISFTSSAGTPNPAFIPSGAGTQFAIDNISLNATSAPEPSSLAIPLLAIPLALRRKPRNHS
ncbi:MAG: hypothetical protein ACTHN5_03555 [Phycisphaerae bacterium]